MLVSASYKSVFCACLFMVTCVLVLIPLLHRDDLGMVYVQWNLGIMVIYGTESVIIITR